MSHAVHLLIVVSMNKYQSAASALRKRNRPTTPERVSRKTSASRKVIYSSSSDSDGESLEPYNHIKSDITPSHIATARTRNAAKKELQTNPEVSESESTDDDVRTHDSRRKRTRRPHGNNIRYNHAVDFDYIGRHKLEPRLPIRAKIGGRNLIMVLFEEDVPPELTQNWQDYTSKNGYVHRKYIDLDSALFPDIAPGIEIGDREKSRIIKAYLVSLKSKRPSVVHEGPGLDMPDLRFRKIKYGPKLHVGVQKEAKNVKVYAYLSTVDALLFCRDTPDIGTEIYSIWPELIEFEAQFDKGNINSTKAFIKQILIGEMQRRGNPEKISYCWHANLFRR